MEINLRVDKVPGLPEMKIIPHLHQPEKAADQATLHHLLMAAEIAAADLPEVVAEEDHQEQEEVN
jgi:hypothetical protein